MSSSNPSVPDGGELAGLFESYEDPRPGMSALADAYRPPDDPDRLGYDLLDALRDHLTVFCLNAQRVDGLRSAGGDNAA